MCGFGHFRFIAVASRETRARLTELFGSEASSIKAEPRSFNFRYRSPEHFLDVFKTFYDPVLTIFRLPTGIFYAQGVKTNVLFFQRGKTDKVNTKAVWVYDIRANVPAFGKTRPLTVADFADFEKAYGDDPNGGSKRNDQGEEGRWWCLTRDAIKARNDNLDIAWLRNTETEAEEQLTEPKDIAAAIIGHLKAALEDIETLSEELERRCGRASCCCGGSRMRPRARSALPPINGYR